MVWALNPWYWTPRNEVVFICGDVKIHLGPLTQRRRIVSIVESEKRGYLRFNLRTNRTLRSVGYWDLESGSFVSTDPMLSSELFDGLNELIDYLRAKNPDGEFHECPLCNQTRADRRVTSEWGIMLRFGKT